ncbi:unnamed protein product [Sphagnum balticum]
MKILVVSILRLGDILISTSVLRNLKQQFPNAEIHVLINGRFASVSQLIPYVSKVYGLESDNICTIVESYDHSLLEGYLRLEELVTQLQAESYDKVINLTRNRLSGWLTTLLGCSDTKGMMYSKQGKFISGSSWFEYLNVRENSGNGNIYHFVDSFHYGAGLHTSDRRFEFRESERGREFARRLLNRTKNSTRFLIQWSGDEAQSAFSTAKWKRIAELVKSTDPLVDIFIVGTPTEAKAVEEFCSGTPFIPAIGHLDEIFSLFQNSHVLLTCDNAIKHLASATKIQVLELSFGQAEFRKTGVYTSNAVILKQKTDIEVSVEIVALFSGALLRRDEVGLRSLAQECLDEVEAFRTHINDLGDWSAYPVAEKFSSAEIASWIDRASSKLWLERAHEKQIGEFGSEGVELKHLLERIFPDRSGTAWLSELRSLESRFTWLNHQFETYLGKLKDVLPRFDTPTAMDRYLGELKSFCQEMEPLSIFQSYADELGLALQEAGEGVVPFQFIRKIRGAALGCPPAL